MTDGTVRRLSVTKYVGFVPFTTGSATSSCASRLLRASAIREGGRHARHFDTRTKPTAREPGRGHHDESVSEPHQNACNAEFLDRSEGSMSRDMDRDEKDLLLRDQGRPFVGIAEILELGSARAANAAFNRGLRGRPLGLVGSTSRGGPRNRYRPARSRTVSSDRPSVKSRARSSLPMDAPTNSASPPAADRGSNGEAPRRNN